MDILSIQMLNLCLSENWPKLIPWEELIVSHPSQERIRTHQR